MLTSWSFTRCVLDWHGSCLKAGYRAVELQRDDATYPPRATPASHRVKLHHSFDAAVGATRGLIMADRDHILAGSVPAPTPLLLGLSG